MYKGGREGFYCVEDKMGGGLRVMVGELRRESKRTTLGGMNDVAELFVAEGELGNGRPRNELRLEDRDAKVMTTWIADRCVVDTCENYLAKFDWR